MRPWRLLALSTLALALAATATAQTRPLLTEQATTNPAGTLVFETGLDVIAGEPSYVTGVERSRWDGPLLRLVYSPADNVELDLEWVARVGVWGETGRGEIQSSDWGDVTLRAKWRMVEGRDGRATLGARFGITLPETKFEDEQFRPLGLGPNTLRMFAEGLLTKPVGRAEIHANAGLFLQDEIYRPHEQVDYLSFGLAVAWRLVPSLSAVAEVAGTTGRGSPGPSPLSEARAGVRFGRGRARGDVALRRGLSRAAGTWGATAGLSWTIH
jgi:hypothetical protein